jgi:hypothetical protein
VVIEDPDIFRAATLLIDQHGEEAPLRAARRADELLKDGDVDGSAVWGRILTAVKELRRGRRDGEPLNYRRKPLPANSAALQSRADCSIMRFIRPAVGRPRGR